MAKRRGNQDGTFYKRANGSWCGQIMLNNKRYTVYAKGIQECRAKLRDKINEVKMFSSPAIPFSIYANKFIDDQVENKIIKQSTAHIKKNVVNKFISIVGDQPINKIDKNTFNKFTSVMIKSGAKYKSIITYLGYIRSVLHNAYIEEIIDKEVPLDTINKGPKSRTKRLIPTLDQAKQIIESYKGEKKVFLYILLYSGLRGNEGLALKWTDIDLNNCKIYINRAIQSVGTKYFIDTPKSNRVGEYAQFSTTLRTILEDYKASKEMFTDDYLFDYQDAGIKLSSIRKSFSRKLRNIKCSGGLHVLRHLHASILLNNGIDLKTIQSQLRHQNIDTTNKYLHELEEDTRSSIRNLDF